MPLRIGGEDSSLCIADNVRDDSVTLEFRSVSLPDTEGEIMVGVTYYDREQSPLLVHVPQEVDYTLLAALVRYTADWVRHNEVISASD